MVKLLKNLGKTLAANDYDFYSFTCAKWGTMKQRNRLATLETKAKFGPYYTKDFKDIREALDIQDLAPLYNLNITEKYKHWFSDVITEVCISHI